MVDDTITTKNIQHISVSNNEVNQNWKLIFDNINKQLLDLNVLEVKMSKLIATLQ